MKRAAANTISSKSPRASAAHSSPNSSRHSTGLNLWAEWARIEVSSLRGVPYVLPERKYAYAGSVLCLARTEHPDTSSFDAPEIVHRMQKQHHAGLIVQSPDPQRVACTARRIQPPLRRDVSRHRSRPQ